MSERSLQAQVEAARAYEALFVPALFGPWASKVADVAQVVHGQHVLDVACGTGVLAREVRVRAGPSGNVVGLDPGSGMLTVAREIAPSVQWREGVAESIPFPDGAFDAVVSQFGLMFFVDRGKALGEMLRVLKPGGRLVVAVWDSLRNNPAYAAEVELIERLAGASAADALRAPFVLGDRSRLHVMFDDAGARSVRISTVEGAAHFPGVRAMVEADLRGWLPVMGVHLTEDQIARVLAEAEHVLDSYVTVEGGVKFRTSAHIVAATNA